MRKDQKELLACHTCDKPACYNPKHLWLWTVIDDVQDMLAKGRSRKGSKHGNAKLTETQVQQIRQQFARGQDYYTLSQKYSTTRQNIYHIVHRKTWIHI